MMKNINNFWAKQSETILTGAFAVVMAVAAITVRYMNYFL